MNDTEGLTQLGSKKTEYKFEEPEVEILETFENPEPKREYVIELSSEEVTALCPVTSQPDFYSVEIRYCPRAKCVESKSLKLYLGAWRNYGAFIEKMTNKILSDLVKACEPEWMDVKNTMKPRGGIPITVIVHYSVKA